MCLASFGSFACQNKPAKLDNLLLFWFDSNKLTAYSAAKAAMMMMAL